MVEVEASNKFAPEEIQWTQDISSPGSSEKIPIPEEIYNYKVVLIAIVAASAATIIGYDAGFIGGTVSLNSFQEEFGLSIMSAHLKATVEANVVSVFQAGAYFGCLMFYPVGELLGRKIGLILSGFLLTLGAAISLIANSHTGLAAIYVGRVLTGVGIGGCSGLAPIYVSEISPAAIRGKLIGCWEVSWQVGGIIGYWINYGVLRNVPHSRKQWMIPFAVQLIPSVIFWVLCFLLPESPRFLITKGQIERAKENLSSLRSLPQDDPYFVQELDNISKSIQENLDATGTDFFAPIKTLFGTRKMLYRLLLSTSMFMMQNGFGINAVTYYSPTIFKSLGVQDADAGLLSTGIFGVLKGAASVFWVFVLVDTFGRRVCLCYIAIPCTICMWYLGAYIKIADPEGRLARGSTGLTASGVAARATLYIWTIFYGCSWNGTPWVVCAEIFPQSVRTAAQAVNASSNWFWAFMIGHFTGQALAAIGYGYYFIFAACSFVFPIVVWFVYPETKGVPLEAIDYLFEVRPWRARSFALKKFEIEYDGAPISEGESQRTESESEDAKQQ